MRYFPLFFKSLIVMGLIFSVQVNATTTKNTWYGGFSLLSLKSDYINSKDLERSHDRQFFRRSVGGSSYGQRVIDYDDATTGYRYFIGVTPYDAWEFELGFIDFGEISGTYTSGDIAGPFDRGVLEGISTLKGIAAHVQFRQPFFDFEDWRWMVRLGLMAWDGELQTRFITDNDSIKVKNGVINNRGYDEFFGLGLNYRVSDRWRIRFDANRYVMGSAETDALSATLDYRFDWALF